MLQCTYGRRLHWLNCFDNVDIVKKPTKIKARACKMATFATGCRRGCRPYELMANVWHVWDYIMIILWSCIDLFWFGSSCANAKKVHLPIIAVFWTIVDTYVFCREQMWIKLIVHVCQIVTCMWVNNINCILSRSFVVQLFAKIVGQFVLASSI